MEVWVFTGARSSTSTNATFPGGVFSSIEVAENWIRRHGLSGIELTERQPPSHTRGHRARERRVQHFSPLPNHASPEDGMPGSSPAFLVWARSETRI